MTKKSKLTLKQKRFAEEMANPSTSSAKEAAIKAGYSRKSAAESACENLMKSNVVSELDKRKARAALMAKINQQQVLGATAEIAFSSIADLLDADGNFDFRKAVENGADRLIKKITRSVNQFGENVAVELYSKPDALAKIGEYLGMKQKDKENDDALAQIKKHIERRAEEKNVPYKTELEDYLNLFGDDIRSEIKDDLASELIN
ncbi:MAG: terminase small subunit [Pyrinomonadaceae bacterium]